MLASPIGAATPCRNYTLLPRVTASSYIEAMKKEPAKIQELRTKLVEHLESALAVSDEIGDYATGSLIERALKITRADPFTDQPPRFGATPKCRRFTQIIALQFCKIFLSILRM